MPHGGGVEGLPGLGAIHRLGRQGVDGEGRAGEALGLLVGVEEDAGLALELLVGVPGHQVHQAVEEGHLGGVVPEVLEGRGAQEAVAVRGPPPGGEAQAEVEVLLLVDQVGPQEVLEQAPADAPHPAVGVVEGMPEGGAPAPGDPQGGHRPGGPGGVVELVLGDVGEEGGGRAHPPAGQRPVAGGEEPEVRVADHRHQERRQGLHLLDAVARLTVGLDQGAGRPGGVGGHRARAVVDASGAVHVRASLAGWVLARRRGATTIDRGPVVH